MLQIKKLVIVVSLLLVVVMGASVLSRSLIDVGKGGTVREDGYTGIGLPEKGSVVTNKPLPLEDYFSYTGDGSRKVLNQIDSHIVYQYSSGYTVTGKEYTMMLLATPGSRFNDGVPLSEYSHMKIEFDLVNELSYLPLGCTFWLEGRDLSNVSGASSISTMSVEVGTSEESLMLTTCKGEILKGNKFHVEYVIDIDHVDPNCSRIQVFIDDVLYADSDLLDRNPFYNTYGFVVDRYSEIRIKGFNTEAENASIGFKNLVVTGYNE